MIIDARSLPQGVNIETDVCIAGAGVAGVTVAREFINSKFRVCLLESGGVGPDRATQSLLWGENIGHPYFPLDTARSCGFGGSSHRWTAEHVGSGIGVRLRSLDKIDFEERDWVPFSGWPFPKSDLDPFYERAHAICKIGPFTYDTRDWEDPQKTPHLPFLNDRVQTTIFQFGSRDPFISDYREEIDQAENMTVYTYANATEIEASQSGTGVARLRVGCVPDREFSVSAKIFVLALGAIEIPRLLLLSNKTWSSGLGNPHDLVGRFFMEHPHIWSGEYVPSSPALLDLTRLYRLHEVGRLPIMGKLTISPEVLRRERMLNYCVSMHPEISGSRPNVTTTLPVLSWPLLTAQPEPPSAGGSRPQKKRPKGVESLKVLLSSMSRGRVPENLLGHLGTVISDMDSVAAAGYKRIQAKSARIGKHLRTSRGRLVFKLNHMTEQSPNPNSRVTLSHEKDPLGRNRVCLDWQVVPLDIRSIIRAQEIIDAELQRARLGRLKIELTDEIPCPTLEGGWHHMGTTRMHRDPKNGVVDENCRVHGIHNLFIAGPSVFPTCGFANPVLTSVALAARLSDHIKHSLKRASFPVKTGEDS